MMDFVQPYIDTVLVLGLTGFLFFIQLMVADVVRLKAKCVPGYPIEPSHSSILFRATRAIENSNESAAILILFSLFAILSSADPDWVNTSAFIYLGGRILHMLCYYLNLKLGRSVAFVISLIGLLGMFIAGIKGWG
ncbi:MAPEG family protein [Grimontia kaedaensis]|uniref:MAPEG family protein n=1 Tax=Grimontia kaedaensis TaxID=2872157 RepID=A0ABY4WZG0_9GAMM|nr:MAPEG family protein [Grimontia kaedaensis]USH04362.1 MAPEG family protein [Grimontia kaedaensis]